MCGCVSRNQVRTSYRLQMPGPDRVIKSYASPVTRDMVVAKTPGAVALADTPTQS